MSMSPPAVTQDTVWSNYTHLESPKSRVVLNSMCLLICICGLAGNGTIIFFLGFRVKRNKFTVYVLNLALADFMFLMCISSLLVITFVFDLHPETFHQHPDKDQVMKIAASVVMVCLFGYNTSLYLLTAISVERCLSALFPIWSQCHRPKHQSAVVCGLVWMLSCLMTAAECVICDKEKYVSEEQAVLSKNSRHCEIVFIIINILSFLVFTPLMILSSVTLLIIVKKGLWKQQLSKLYVVIVVTVILFLIFAMPMRVIIQVGFKYNKLLPIKLIDTCMLLCSINSSANPFVYWFVGRREGGKGSLQMTFQRIFRDDFKEHKLQHQWEITGRNGAETVL
ncbi:proto-oncogene Mas-like isoform X2 [Lissotriton helveticus]